MDIDGVAEEMPGTASLAKAFSSLGAAYKIIRLESREAGGEPHDALYDIAERKVYDKCMGLIGIDPEGYREAVEGSYWINGSFCSTAGLKEI